jgi:hypothetical protein
MKCLPLLRTSNIYILKHSNKNWMLLGVYFYWQYHNIPKGIILGIIFPNNQSVTFLPNVEVLKSNEKKVIDALSICLLTCYFQSRSFLKIVGNIIRFAYCKIEHMLIAIVWLGNRYCYIAYNWTVEDEWKVTWHDLIPDLVRSPKTKDFFLIIIPRVFIGHLLYSETNLYYFKFHWNKHHNKHHSSFLEKEKKSKTKLFSKTYYVKMKLINRRGYIVAVIVW